MILAEDLRFVLAHNVEAGIVLLVAQRAVEGNKVKKRRDKRIFSTPNSDINHKPPGMCDKSNVLVVSVLYAIYAVVMVIVMDSAMLGGLHHLSTDTASCTRAAPIVARRWWFGLDSKLPAN